MNNGNQPANPTTGLCDNCLATHINKQDFSGLTKREVMAMHIMSGFASDSVMNCDFVKDNAAERSVEWADELLKELNK